MEKLNDVITAIDDFVWGPVMLILLVGTGIFLTIRTRFLTWRNLGYALKSTLSKEARTKSRGEGDVSPFSALTTALAAATQKHVYSKVISNIREVKARGAYVILLSKDKEITDPSICDVHINLPDVSDEFTIFESVVIFQLIAYYTSVGKGLNPDQPRNLAKSVTVE